MFAEIAAAGQQLTIEVITTPTALGWNPSLDVLLESVGLRSKAVITVIWPLTQMQRLRFLPLCLSEDLPSAEIPGKLVE